MEKLASLGTPVYIAMQMEQPEWQKLRDDIWQEYWKERRNKICNRCGNCVRYYVNSEELQRKVPEDYEAPPDRYYLIRYFMAKERIDTDNTVTSDWYHICDKCIDHVRGKKPYPLDNNWSSAKAELEMKMTEEMKRRHSQEIVIKQYGKKLKIRKEAEARLPTYPKKVKVMYKIPSRDDKITIDDSTILSPEERVRQPEISIINPKPNDSRYTGWRSTLHSTDGIEGEILEDE